MSLQQNKVLFSILIALSFLIIPLVGNQLSPSVNWSIFDFGIMAILLSLVGFTIGIVISKTSNWASRLAFIALVLIVFFLIWAELAVGIFNTPFAGS